MMFGIDHINVKSRDMEAMKDFLVGVLGVEQGDRPAFDFPGYWLYLDGKPIIHMMLAEDDRPETGWIDHIAFGPCRFDQQIERLDRGGFHYSTTGIPGTGIRQIFVTGPEGAKLELQCPE